MSGFITVELHDDSSVIANICQSYWEFEDSGQFRYSASSIAKANNISTNELSRLIRDNCTAFSTTVACQHCGIPYIYKNRQDFNYPSKSKEWVCINCENTIRESLETKKIERLIKSWESSMKFPINPESLDARQAIFLFAFLRFGSTEDFSYIEGIRKDGDIQLSPHNDFDTTIIRELYHNEIISIDPASDTSHITIKDDDNFSFSILQVKWLVVTEIPMTEFFQALEQRVCSTEFLLENKDAIQEIAREIALEECLGYLSRALKEHGLGYDFGAKTSLVLKSGLKYFSVAQMYSFIWRAAKDAIAYYARNRTYKSHASKTVVANIEGQIEKALANNWNVTAYARNYQVPQSMLSRVLFNNILKTDDGGFNMQIDTIFDALDIQ